MHIYVYCVRRDSVALLLLQGKSSKVSQSNIRNIYIYTHMCVCVCVRARACCAYVCVRARTRTCVCIVCVCECLRVVSKTFSFFLGGGLGLPLPRSLSRPLLTTTLKSQRPSGFIIVVIIGGVIIVGLSCTLAEDVQNFCLSRLLLRLRRFSLSLSLPLPRSLLGFKVQGLVVGL
jgi:hypothetical protein